MVWYRLIDLLGDFYGYTLQHCLYKLTFPQALTLIDTRNDRERKAHEAAERQSHADDPNWVDMDDPRYRVDQPQSVDDLPTLDDLKGAFGLMFG